MSTYWLPLIRSSPAFDRRLRLLTGWLPGTPAVGPALLLAIATGTLPLILNFQIGIQFQQPLSATLLFF